MKRFEEYLMMYVRFGVMRLVKFFGPSLWWCHIRHQPFDRLRVFVGCVMRKKPIVLLVQVEDILRMITQMVVIAPHVVSLARQSCR